ncbi:4-alpha-glucanotransferase [Acidipila sp. EB88]|uniref:4-alpha-glucanotransferase n=1 Tax=Acidipila sp. EB88 TaxID=2305226 RepID=UPI000F5F4065|nr:4-alpha-glucanotransferase [Acidipila sp. EB88]RRA47345.1 4-alpha-glucanotransferase [Acidipila sp. EB88]
MPFDRASGLLLHISSLPSHGGIGDLGPAAYDFANFLEAAGQRIWQVLPLSPVGYGNSPYASLSAMAVNPLLVSLEVLRDWGWLTAEQLNAAALPTASGPVDFDTVIQQKLPLLREAAASFLKQRGSAKEPAQWVAFEKFCADKADWLDDYVAFVILREAHGNALWTEWEAPLAHRDPAALAAFRKEQAHALEVEKAIQFAFDEQWRYLRAYCAERGIQLMGDIAIFVSFDSADVWTHPEIFELREDKMPLRVAGVPPDYFSETGQRWGNPLYRWDTLAQQDFAWWVGRMRRATELYDMIRLDHFRGFEAFWAIPGEDETAVNGTWVKAPGHALFAALEKELGQLALVAEDLGVITDEVDKLRTDFKMPGMRILQFGFGNRGAHSYLPHRFESNAVVYTGTHDNDTTLGWWQTGSTPEERKHVAEYLSIGEDGPVWAMIRAASSSVADLCLFPVQDVLELGSEARMNVPSAATGNWSWRYNQSALTRAIADKLSAITDITDRTLRAQREIVQAAKEKAAEAAALEPVESPS